MDRHEQDLTTLHCRLLKPVRDHEGRSRFVERPRVLHEVTNLGRHMYLVQFDDGATTYLFPNEIRIGGQEKPTPARPNAESGTMDKEERK
jgi:hypothetical protein